MCPSTDLFISLVKLYPIMIFPSTSATFLSAVILTLPSLKALSVVTMLVIEVVPDLDGELWVRDDPEYLRL